MSKPAAAVGDRIRFEVLKDWVKVGEATGTVTHYTADSFFHSGEVFYVDEDYVGPDGKLRRRSYEVYPGEILENLGPEGAAE